MTLFVAAFVLLQLPGNSVVSNELQNAGHTLAFSALTFVALHRRLFAKSILLVGGLAMLIGVVIELGQSATGRGFGAMDIAKDLIGIIAGICCYLAFSSSGKPNHRLIAFTAGSLILASSLAPTLALLLSKGLSPQPPVLLDFEQWGVEHRILNTGTVTSIELHDIVWITNQTLSLEVKYLPGLWPSVRFIEPYANWSRFGCFTFNVYNQQTDTVSINLRVDDPDLGPDNNDHMTITRDLPPGETQVTVPLDELQQQALLGNHPGEPHMKNIRSFMFYIRNIDEPITLLIDDIALGCRD